MSQDCKAGPKTSLSHTYMWHSACYGLSMVTNYLSSFLYAFQFYIEKRSLIHKSEWTQWFQFLQFYEAHQNTHMIFFPPWRPVSWREYQISFSWAVVRKKNKFLVFITSRKRYWNQGHHEAFKCYILKMLCFTFNGSVFLDTEPYNVWLYSHEQQ